jgi:hypothetical protein
MHTAWWRRPRGSSSAGRPASRAAPPLPSGHCGSPTKAACSTVEHGAARLSLMLDRRRRMGEGSAAGVLWKDGLGKGGWGSRCQSNLLSESLRIQVARIL